MLRGLVGLIVLAAIDLLGEAIAQVTHSPVPGNVIGMLLLTALLLARVVPLSLVERAADFLLEWLALLFVPAAVSVALHVDVLRGELLGVALVVVATTFVVLLVTGLVAERFVASGRAAEEKKR